MNKLMQTAPRFLRGRMYQRDTSRPKEQRILVLKTGMSGMNFHVENENEQKALNSITPGTEFMLVREPDNKYDAWAVAVYLTETDRIGYISRYKNEAIARMMDAGKKFIAVADDPDEILSPEEKADRESRRIRPASTENMNFPFSVYLIEERE